MQDTNFKLVANLIFGSQFASCALLGRQAHKHAMSCAKDYNIHTTPFCMQIRSQYQMNISSFVFHNSYCETNCHRSNNKAIVNPEHMHPIEKDLFSDIYTCT